MQHVNHKQFSHWESDHILHGFRSLVGRSLLLGHAVGFLHPKILLPMNFGCQFVGINLYFFLGIIKKMNEYIFFID